VFSRESLDIGTRFLLNNLPSNPAFNDFIDLGCGNGVVGVMIARNFLSAKLKFVDESYMAIASAEQNFHAAFRRQRHAEFILDDCLSNMPLQSSDCIVCNPPFHQQHTIADHVARQMFKQSLKVLRSGGELRVIGNRHLNYHILLKKIFGNVLQIAGNAKFVIFSAIKN
jgi:16S rRNA (guanine1207-N2)-methyltransferase